MNHNEITCFLKKFDIKDENIAEFFLNKKIIEKNENIFLSERKIEKNLVYTDTLIYIKLLKLLPSMFLLDFIYNNTQNILYLKNSKNAINFTYGKDLKLDAIDKKIKLEENKMYILLFDEEIIGIIKYENNLLKNEMNIGEYLKENNDNFKKNIDKKNKSDKFSKNYN